MTQSALVDLDKKTKHTNALLALNNIENLIKSNPSNKAELLNVKNELQESLKNFNQANKFVFA